MFVSELMFSCGFFNEYNLEVLKRVFLIKIMCVEILEY